MIPVRLVIALGVSAPLFAGSTPTTVALGSSVNPVVLGYAVSFTATVTPSTLIANVSGKVTFYDGAALLETVPVQPGMGWPVLRTRLLSPGTHSLRAYYSGDQNYAASLSPVLTQNVNALPENGFQAATNYSVGGTVTGVGAIGDFNGDGYGDIAVGEISAGTFAGNVSVLMNNGIGGFGLPNINKVGSHPGAIVVGDFNGDGKADLAVGDASDFVSVLLNTGQGAFQAPLVAVNGTGSGAMGVGDFNGDGKDDLLVGSINGAGGLSIFFGNGDGTFQPPTAVAPGVDGVAFLVTDLNGDGKADIIGVDLQQQMVSVLLGNGDGTFRAPLNYVPVPYHGDFALGDFNGDGKVDLALTGFNTYGVAVLLGNGDGSFQPAVEYASFGPTLSVTVGDFNGDQKADLLVGTTDSSAAEIYTGNGDGTLQAPVVLSTPSGLVGDFNGDGRTDVISLSPQQPGSEAVWLGQPEPCVAAATAPIYTDANGGRFTVPILSDGTLPACSWSGTADSSWIGFPEASGTGAGTLVFNAGFNTSGADQSGMVSVMVSGQPVSTIPVTQRFTASVFADVPPGTYYFDAVNLLAAKGITSGCGVNPPDFCPGNDVTRAQMAIFIVRSVYGGDNFTASQTPYFNDVGPANFGFKWIQKLYELGITTGCGNGDFCPDEPVTRAQMAIFVVRARYGATAQFYVNPTPYFTDVPAGAFGFDWIQSMASDNITAGCGPMLFCPNQVISRGDVSVFLMRGEFNQLLPAGEPVISQISPASIPLGQQTTVTVTGVNTTFGAGTLVNPIPGVTIGAVTVTGPTSLTVDLTALVNATVQPESIWTTTGSQQAVLPNGLTFQPACPPGAPC